MSALHTGDVRLHAHPPTTARPWGPCARLSPALLALGLLAGCAPGGAPPATELPAPIPRPTLPDGPPVDDVEAPPRVEVFGSVGPEIELPRPAGAGPRVQVQPADGVLQGTVTLRVVADSAGGLDTLAFTEPASLVRVRPQFDEAGTRAELTAELHTEELPDGPLSVSVIARDAGGHETRRTGRFVVSNSGPVIEWDTPQRGAVLRGVAEVAAEAHDPRGVVALTLEGVHQTRSDRDPRPEHLRVALDTTTLPDGRHRLRLHARDVDGNRSTLTRWVIIDNAPAPVIRGAAWSGGPVVGARVKVFAYGRHGLDAARLDRCPDDGCPTDAAGAFSVTLEDGHRGAVRVRVTPAGDGSTTATDPLTEERIPWPAEAGLSALLPAAATRAVRPSLATTLVDWTVIGRTRGGEAFDAAYSAANSLWGAHLCDHCDVSTTEPAGAGRHIALTPAVRLGLVDGGVSRLAEWLTENAALRGDGRPTSRWQLMALLRRDLTDGVLDGRRRGNDLTDPRVHPFTLRGDLAAAIDLLVQARRDWLAVPREALRGEGGWLDGIAGRRSALWPATPLPAPLDVSPPTVEIVAPQHGSAHGPRVIELIAQVGDDAGEPMAHVVGPAGAVVEWAVRDGRLDGQIDVSDCAEGPTELRVLAEDTVGHITEARVEIVVDHTRPGLELRRLEGAVIGSDDVIFTAQGTFAFRAVLDSAETEITVDHPADIRPLPDGALIIVRGYGPGAQTIRVDARDLAGNISRAKFDLHWQVEGPRIEVSDYQYRWTDHEAVDCRRLRDDPLGPEICDFRLTPRWWVSRPAAELYADDAREPPIVRTFPPIGLDLPAYTRIALHDETGAGRLEWRRRLVDGGWSPWSPAEEGDHGFELRLDLPQSGAPADQSSLEHVEFRGWDGAGRRVVRGLRWRRTLQPPPLSVREHIGYAESENADVPGSYGFSRGRSPAALAAERGPEQRGPRLGMWRVYNPWPVPVRIEVTAPSLFEHRRSYAYRTAAVFPEIRDRCPGLIDYFLGNEQGRRTGGCGESPWTLVPSGEWVEAVDRLDSAFTHEDPDGVIRAVPEGGLEIPPGSHRDIFLQPRLPFWSPLVDGEVDVPSEAYLQVIDRARDRQLHMTTVERDARLVWQINGPHFVVHVDGGEGYFLTRFDSRTVEIVNPPLALPSGLELR